MTFIVGRLGGTVYCVGSVAIVRDSEAILHPRNVKIAGRDVPTDYLGQRDVLVSSVTAAYRVWDSVHGSTCLKKSLSIQTYSDSIPL